MIFRNSYFWVLIQPQTKPTLQNQGKSSSQRPRRRIKAKVETQLDLTDRFNTRPRTTCNRKLANNNSEILDRKQLAHKQQVTKKISATKTIKLKAKLAERIRAMVAKVNVKKEAKITMLKRLSRMEQKKSQKVQPMMQVVNLSRRCNMCRSNRQNSNNMEEKDNRSNTLNNNSSTPPNKTRSNNLRKPTLTISKLCPLRAITNATIKTTPTATKNNTNKRKVAKKKRQGRFSSPRCQKSRHKLLLTPLKPALRQQVQRQL